MMFNEFLDKFVKHAVITLFVAVIAGIFYAGYAAGAHGQWWMGLITIILYPVLSKFLKGD